MNLAQAIHARWSASAALNALLPAARVMTGAYLAEQAGGPYAVIELPGSSVEGYCNDGSAVERVGVRMVLHHDDYDAGCQLAEAVARAFDRSDFDLAGGDRVLNMQKRGECSAVPASPQSDRPGGHWQWTIELECRVYRAAATT